MCILNQHHLKCRTLEKFSLPLNISLPCTYISQYKAGRENHFPSSSVDLWETRHFTEKFWKKIGGKIYLSNVNKQNQVYNKKYRRKPRSNYKGLFYKPGFKQSLLIAQSHFKTTKARQTLLSLVLTANQLSDESKAMILTKISYIQCSNCLTS